MYEAPPDEAELAAFGLTPSDMATTVEIWPENVAAYGLFAWAGTQWRTGASGATGLDYGPLLHKMDRMRLKQHAYEELENQVQIMEAAALGEMNKPKK